MSTTDNHTPLSADSLRERLRGALISDFRDLYVKEYTSDYKVKRIVQAVEIDIMELENTMLLIAAALQSERQRIAAELPKAIASVEVDIEATRKHMESKGATENDILNMEIEADDRKDTLHDALRAVRAVLIPPTGGLETPDTAPAGGNQVDNPVEPQ